MKITKMHGLGNDFILIDDPQGRDVSLLAKKLCERRLSVGADGIVLIEPSSVADIKMRIINADGSEAEMCGNGIRCFARYVYETGIVKKEKLSVQTLAGVMHPELVLKGGKVFCVRVGMGKPVFRAADIPILTDKPLSYTMDAGGRQYEAHTVLMGVPHTIVLCDSLSSVCVEEEGRAIETHPLFPKKTNVNFVEIVDGGNLRMRTWERGAGATLACGTGACAAAVVCSELGKTQRTVDVHIAAGTLHIEYLADGRVMMSGPAAYVFSGETIDED
ncbi:MAG: diaminopimelate epimerase [Christensenellaceae bacterium]